MRRSETSRTYRSDSNTWRQAASLLCDAPAVWYRLRPTGAKTSPLSKGCRAQSPHNAPSRAASGTWKLADREDFHSDWHQSMNEHRTLMTNIELCQRSFCLRVVDDASRNITQQQYRRQQPQGRETNN